MTDANEGHRRRLPGAPGSGSDETPADQAASGQVSPDETPSDEEVTHTGIRLPRKDESEPERRDQSAEVTPAATHRIPTAGETAPTETVDDDEGSERRGGLVGFLRETAIVITVALVISFLVKTFLAQPFWIPSGSMNDTLIRGDRVIVSKLTPGPIDLDRGDIVVFEDPGGWLPTEPTERGPLLKGLEFVGLYPAGDNHLIKRVIGLPGDKVVCCDSKKRLTVNGTPLNEPYLHQGDGPSATKFSITVPSDKVWVMGDHRSDSSDSRFHDDGSGRSGSVPIDNITGRAVMTVWPLDRIGWLGNYSSTFDKVGAP